MLSINSIARVIVNTVRTSASPASFNTGLLLVQDANYTAERRLQSYGSAAGAAAGILTGSIGKSFQYINTFSTVAVLESETACRRNGSNTFYYHVCKSSQAPGGKRKPAAVEFCIGSTSIYQLFPGETSAFKF